MTTERVFEYQLLDVFSKVRMRGNQLAVLPSADGLSTTDMQRIANEFNLPETAFISADDECVARVRIFTPQRELDFAGHPTIGSAHAIYHRAATNSNFSVKENVGPVKIERALDGDGTEIFWLTTPPISFHGGRDAEFCARLLGLEAKDIDQSPPEYVSAGSPLLFVPLTSVEAVDRAQLKSEYLTESIGSAGSVGTFLFCTTNHRGVFGTYARMFAPQTGIPEDPGTGGATGPLAAYLLEHNYIKAADGFSFTSEQGTKMGRRSLLHVRIGITDGVTKIQVGGSVVEVAEGVIRLD